MYRHSIQHATIVDGTGKSPFLGDIAMESENIAAVGKPRFLPMVGYARPA